MRCTKARPNITKPTFRQLGEWSVNDATVRIKDLQRVRHALRFVLNVCDLRNKLITMDIGRGSMRLRSPLDQRCVAALAVPWLLNKGLCLMTETWVCGTCGACVIKASEVCGECHTEDCEQGE